MKKAVHLNRQDPIATSSLVRFEEKYFIMKNALFRLQQRRRCTYVVVKKL
jgi:hypothetical protein